MYRNIHFTTEYKYMSLLEARQRRAAYHSLEKGKTITDFFTVSACEARTKGNGDGFLSVVLSHCAGVFDGRVWDIKPGDQDSFKPGSVVLITAEMDFYNKPQLKILAFEAKEDLTLAEEQELIRCALREQEELETQLLEQLRPSEDTKTGALIGVHNPILGKLLRKYIKDASWWERFCTLW